MPNYISYKKLGRIGRLGNQLWQICGTAGAVAKYNYENNYDYEIVMPYWENAHFFSFPDNWFVDNNVLKISHNINAIVEKENSVYLGNVDYIDFIHEDIKQWLKPSSDALKILTPYIEKYDPHNKTCVHVRRGDYQYWYKGANLLPKEYFENNWPEGEVLIFSDDPQWCKENLPEATLVHHDPLIDLSLMRMCKAHVISNSTFSWWGAYGSKGVVYPDPWVKHKEGNIIPKDNWYPSTWY